MTLLDQTTAWKYLIQLTLDKRCPLCDSSWMPSTSPRTSMRDCVIEKTFLLQTRHSSLMETQFKALEINFLEK